MEVTGREEDVDARTCGGADGFGGRVNVLPQGARETGDLRLFDFARDGGDRFVIAL